MLINTHITYIFVFMAALVHFTDGDNECCLNSSLAYRSYHCIFLFNFKSFSELKFNCDTIYDIDNLVIGRYDERLILDLSLNLNFTMQPGETFSMYLHDLKGFDLDSNPFESFNLIGSTFLETETFYVISRANFYFYLQSDLINVKLCDKLNGWAMLSTTRTIMLKYNIDFSL